MGSPEKTDIGGSEQRKLIQNMIHNHTIHHSQTVFRHRKAREQAINDAKKILIERNMNEDDSDLLTVAIALFEKRASHSIYWKESAAKEKV